MKKIFKKNQLIITALAALLAVAGYLNYTERNIDNNISTVSVDDTDGLKSDNESISGELESETSDSKIASTDDTYQNTPDETPGEAIFVNATGTLDFIVEAKMTKEYNRVTMQESLQEIINNTTLTENERKSAVERMVEITEISEREMAAENLIMSKGYSDVSVTMTDGYVDVIIAAPYINDITRAQIEDIIKRKMGVDASKITINVVNTQKE